MNRILAPGQSILFFASTRFSAAANRGPIFPLTAGPNLEPNPQASPPIGTGSGARPLRILHILHSLAVGGMESRVARLAAGLDPDRFRVSILTFRAPKSRSVALPAHVPVHFQEIPPGLHPGALLRLRAFIRAGKFDVVHTHNWGSMFYGVLAAKLAGTPVIFHGEHGLEVNEGIPWKRLWAQRLLARMAARIVAVNRPIARHAVAAWRLPEARVLCIPNGVDLQRFRPAQKRTDAPAGPLVFGTVARFSQVKNIPCMIKAFALLLERTGRESARLALVGDGPEAQAIRSACESAGILAQVDFPGDTQTPEIHYGRFGVYLNASFYEGMSNTILEAMACGLPVLASDVTGNRDLLNEGGEAWFFRSDDAADLAEKLERCVRDPERRAALGRNGRARVEKEFDNRGFLAGYRRAYAQALGRPELEA